MLPPALVIVWLFIIVSIQREILDVEPILVSRFFPVFENIDKGKKTAPNVVEDAVQHDAHAELVGMLHQVLPVFLRAEVGIDLEIVLRIVAMVGSGVEDGVEVDGRDAH